jgi:hypothetical protein
LEIKRAIKTEVLEGISDISLNYTPSYMSIGHIGKKWRGAM